jgi:hypothetical protein
VTIDNRSASDADRLHAELCNEIDGAKLAARARALQSENEADTLLGQMASYVEAATRLLISGLNTRPPCRCTDYWAGRHKDDCPARMTVGEWLEYANRLERAGIATLLFHDSGPWDEKKRKRWDAATGERDATTKILCDTMRGALAYQETTARNPRAKR